MITYTEKSSTLAQWAQSAKTAEVVALLTEGSGGQVSLEDLEMSCIEAFWICMAIPGLAFRLVGQGKVSELMLLPGFDDSDEGMRQGWRDAHEKVLLANSNVSLEESTTWLRARCQAQALGKPMDPRLLPDAGDTLVWILEVLRGWKGRGGVRIDSGEEDIVKAWATGLAACDLSQGSAGNKVKILTLACAGYIELRWAGALRRAVIDQRHYKGRETLMRRAPGIEKHLQERRRFFLEKWREPTAFEVKTGISAIAQSALRDMAGAASSRSDRPHM